MQQQNKGTIVVVVSGVETTITYNENEPLKNVIDAALKETGNQGRKNEEWQLKYNGAVINDWMSKVETFGFPKNAVLYVSLREGVLG